MLQVILKWCFILFPFIYFNLVMDASGTPRLLFLSLVLVSSFLIVWVRKKTLKAPIYFVIIFTSYIFVVLVNSLIIDSDVDIIEIIKLIDYFLFLILLFNVNWDEHKIKFSSGVITLLVIILALGYLQILFILFNQPEDISDNFYLISATFSHKNIYAIVILLSLPFLVLGNVKRNKKIIIFIASLIMLITLQTRSVLLAFFFSSVYYLYFKKEVLKYRRINLFIISSLVLFVGLFIQHRIGTLNSFIEIFDFGNNFSERYATISERLFLWEQSIKMFFDNWVFGVGIGNWPIYLPFYGLTLWRLRQGEVIMQRPHNDVIENFNELGFLGGAIFVLFLIYPLFVKANFKHKYILNSGLICFLIISLFSFPQERIIPSLLFLSLVAIKLKDVAHINIPKYFTILFLGLTITFTLISCSKLKSEVYFKRYLINRNTLEQSQAINLLSKAKTPFSKRDKTSTPFDWYIGEVFLKNKEVDTATQYFLQALELHPYNIHILNSLGRCSILKNDYDTAIKYFNDAITIAPFFENGLYNLAYSHSLYLDFDKALEVLRKIDNKTSKKFIDINLMYAKSIIISQIKLRGVPQLDKDILVNMLSNNEWILSLVSKSNIDQIKFSKQLIRDLEFLK